MQSELATFVRKKRSESSPTYSSKAKIKYDKEENGVAITYDYVNKDINVKLVVHYVLEDDNLYVYADTSEIEEKDTNAVDGRILTKILLCPQFGAVSATDIDGNPTEGYMIVPDGSGAVINYNNGKTNYSSYSHQVYGRDYTTVPSNAPHVNEQAYLPVLATYQENHKIFWFCHTRPPMMLLKKHMRGLNTHRNTLLIIF